MKLDIPIFQIAVNTLILAAGRLIIYVVGFMSFMMIAGSLGVSGYGEYATIFSILGILAIFLEFGLDQYFLGYLSQGSGKSDLQSFSQFLSTRIFLSIAFTIVALTLALILPYSKNLRQGLILASSIYIFTYLSATFMTFFQSKLRMVGNAVFETAGKIVPFIIVLFLYKYAHLTFYWAIVAYVIGSAFTLLGMVSLFLLSGYKAINIQTGFLKILPILKDTLPLAVASMLNQFFFRIDIPILSHTRGAEETGIYAFAYKIFEMSVYPAAFLTASFYPLLSSILQKKQFDRLLCTFSIILMILGFMVGVFLYIFPPLFINFLPFLSKFRGSIGFLQVLVFALPMLYLQTLLSGIYILRGKQKKIAKIYLIAAVINLMLNMILIPRYGATASAVITVITQIIVVLPMFWGEKRALLSLVYERF